MDAKNEPEPVETIEIRLSGENWIFHENLPKPIKNTSTTYINDITDKNKSCGPKLTFDVQFRVAEMPKRLLLHLNVDNIWGKSTTL